MIVAKSDQHLNALVWQYQSHGWSIVSRTPTTITLTAHANVSGTAHIIHAILTVCTVGLWAPIWLIATLLGNKRQTVTIGTSAQ